MSERVLVAGDDTSLRESLCRHLHLEGYTCDEAADEQRALHLLNVTAGRSYDLVIADLDAFAIDGLLACERLRKRVSPGTSILVTTRPRGTFDALAALERYADDYLAKPFSMREL